MNALCYSFFRQEPARGIYFLYIPWVWISYYFYISCGIPWKCYRNQMSTSYSKCKSDSGFLIKWEFCVHGNCDPVLIFCFPHECLTNLLIERYFWIKSWHKRNPNKTEGPSIWLCECFQ